MKQAALLRARGLMGAVLRHHVALANPKRLLILSQEARKLLAPEEFSRDGVGFVAVGERPIPLLSSYPLGQMAPRPGYKRIFWQRWLDWQSPGTVRWRVGMEPFVGVARVGVAWQGLEASLMSGFGEASGHVRGLQMSWMLGF